MVAALHCDGPDCDVWAHDEMLNDWLILETVTGPEAWHFHSGWCLTRWAADNFEPLVVMDSGDRP